jgi:hypothetical protein
LLHVVLMLHLQRRKRLEMNLLLHYLLLLLLLLHMLLHLCSILLPDAVLLLPPKCFSGNLVVRCGQQLSRGREVGTQMMMMIDPRVQEGLRGTHTFVRVSL